MRDASRGQRLGTRWVDRSMRAKGLVVIAVPIAILVVVLGSTFWFTHVDNRAQNVAANSRQIVDSATTLENSLLSAQTDLGGYLLTGDASFQRSFAQADKSVPTHLGQLEALTLNTPERQTWGPAIQRDTIALVSALDRLKVQRPSPAPSATVLTLLRSVQSETDKLRTDVSTLSSQETALIVSQQSAIHTSSVFLPAIAIAAVALALAGGVMVSQLFTSGVVTRLRRLERATEAVERGEVPVEVPSGHDEIGRLSARLLDTTSQLRERAEERDRARGELENILTASPVVSLRYDVETRRFSYASPNIERLLGISSEVAIAEPGVVIEHFHPDSARELREALVGGPGATGNVSRSCSASVVTPRPRTGAKPKRSTPRNRDLAVSSVGSWPISSTCPSAMWRNAPPRSAGSFSSPSSMLLRTPSSCVTSPDGWFSPARSWPR